MTIERNPLLRLIFCFFMTAGLCFGLPSAGAVQLQETERLSAIIDGIVAAQMSRDRMAGAVIVVVRPDFDPLVRTYGIADAADGAMMTAETLMPLNSVTKVLTAMALVALSERGALALDQDIRSLMPKTELPSTRHPTNILHLLTHSAGYEEFGRDISPEDPKTALSLSSFLTAGGPAQINLPGSRFSYSNYGFAVGGRLVEITTGLSYTAAIRQLLLKPLGIPVHFNGEPRPTDLPLGLGHAFAEGRFQPLPTAGDNLVPAGGAWISGDGMARLISFLLGKEGDQVTRPFGAQTLAALSGPAASPHPSIDGMGLGLYHGNVNGYAVVGHGGSGQGVENILLLNRSMGIGIYAAFSGVDATLSRAPDRFVQSFFDIVLPSLAPTPIQEALANLADYEGTYAWNRRFITSFERIGTALDSMSIAAAQDGTLVLSGFGGTSRWVAVGQDIFALVNRPAFFGTAGRLVFLRREDGHLRGFVLENRPFMEADRLPPLEQPAVLTGAAAVTGGAIALYLLVFVGGRRWRSDRSHRGPWCLYAGAGFSLAAFVPLFVAAIIPMAERESSTVTPGLIASLTLPIIAGLLWLLGTAKLVRTAIIGRLSSRTAFSLGGFAFALAVWLLLLWQNRLLGIWT